MGFTIDDIDEYTKGFSFDNVLEYMPGFKIKNLDDFKKFIDTIVNEDDEFLAQSGRVIDSLLSEHFDEGALEGYILTGRHGFMNSYEAFIRIVDSMISQHAKWLKVTKEL